MKLVEPVEQTRQRRLIGHASDQDGLDFAGFPQDDIVLAVRDGRVDAGTVRSATLERMAKEGEGFSIGLELLARLPGPLQPSLSEVPSESPWVEA